MRTKVNISVEIVGINTDGELYTLVGKTAISNQTQDVTTILNRTISSYERIIVYIYANGYTIANYEALTSEFKILPFYGELPLH